MENSTSCLVNVDGINYKVDLKIKNGERRIDLDSLKKHLSESNHEELSQYDIFNSDKYTIEIFDPHFQEFVQAENNVELTDKAKLRVRSVDITEDTQPPIMNGNHPVEDEILVVKDLEDKRSLVNIVTQLHMSFALIPNRNRRRSSNNFLEESLRMKEKFWSSVAEDMTIARNKNFTPDQCSTAFFGLLSQYQYILRKYKRNTEERVQDLWPFFKSFHHKIECKLFAKGFSHLKSNFDSAKKDGTGQSNKQKKSECTRLEEDFNLITSVLNRLSSFRKPPRAAVWRSIADDMVDYNTANSRMAGLRWQKRFHELLTKYIQISSHESQLDRETWPLYNLFSQVDLGLFMKSPEGNKSHSRQRSRSKRNNSNHTSGSSPIPIDLSDSESEFVVIDEITGESDRDTTCVDLEEEEEINECVQELLQNILDQVTGQLMEL